MANERRVSQAPVEVLIAGDPKARISQAPVEVLVAPTDALVRVSQAPVEVLIQNVRETSEVYILALAPLDP